MPVRSRCAQHRESFWDCAAGRQRWRRLVSLLRQQRSNEFPRLVAEGPFLPCTSPSLKASNVSRGMRHRQLCSSEADLHLTPERGYLSSQFRDPSATRLFLNPPSFLSPLPSSLPFSSPIPLPPPLPHPTRFEMVLLYVFLLGIKPRALSTLGKYCTTDSPSPDTHPGFSRQGFRG